MSDRTIRDAPMGGAKTDRPATRKPAPGTTRQSPINEPAGESSTARDPSAFNFSQRDEDESIPELVRQLMNQGSHLARQEAELVKAEVRSSVNDLKQAAGALAGAAVVGIAGLGVLLMGLAFLLGEAMELWLATLIVAAATLAGAYAMFAGGRKKLQSSSLNVERSRRTLERAPGAISGNPNEVRNNDR